MNKEFDSDLIDQIKQKMNDCMFSNIYYGYCEKRRIGLRKIALEILNEYINKVIMLELKEKRKIAHILCECLECFTDNGYEYIKNDLIPYSLGSSIVLPVIKADTIDHPEDYQPFYWIATIFINDGNYSKYFDFQKGESIESYLLKAKLAEPEVDKIKVSLLNLYLDWIYYNTHHLSESLYLGELDKDLELIRKLKIDVNDISNANEKSRISTEINYYDNLLNDWVEFKKQEITDYKIFCQLKNRKYSWVTAIYYDK